MRWLCARILFGDNWSLYDLYAAASVAAFFCFWEGIERMKVKTLLFISLFILCFIICAQAKTIEVQTLDAENITYYGATLCGNISVTDDIASYGIEIWSNDTSAVENQIVEEAVSGNFSVDLYLIDNTEYSYRAYAKDKKSNYSYGEIKNFKTEKRKEKESPEINFNISVDSLDTIDFAETPNKYFLNNLILNNQDTLKLIAGNNFDGVDGILGAGDENIFINQYFINKYYTDPVLKSLLTVFDGAVYNRDEFIWDGITSLIPDFVANGIYNITPDKLKSTLNTIYGDMGVKRFNGAINSVISNDYTSSDKRTFGYDKANYRIINALVDSTKATNKLVKNYQDGKETIVDGIEDYQGYYLGTIAPQYYNAQNNFLQMNRYLTSNCKNMTTDEIAECLCNMSEYSQEISKYEKYDFIDETASKWKINLEYSYYGKGITEALEKVGKPLDLATSSIATLKTLEQVSANKEQLQGTFKRLQNTTINNKLSIALGDYLYKMEDGFGSFLADTAANVYSAYGKSVVKKAVNETIEKSAKKLVSAENKVYAGQAVDSAIAKANYLLIAADVGGMFSEVISGTKTYLEKAIEAKYLWNIENESKEMLQRDLIKYSENQTEENAIAVLNDLYWIKALKLREITVVKDLYKANGSSWLSLADKSLAELSDGVNELYVSQRDALINASLTETKYTNEVLVLENGEIYTVMDYSAENNGSLETSSGTTMLKNADTRLAGGAELKSGSTLTISSSDSAIYIPFITMESNSKVIINGGRVIVGEVEQNGGTIIVAGDSVVDVTGNATFCNTVALENATVNVDGNVFVEEGTLKIENGKLNVGGNFTQQKTGTYEQDT
ncbi:MAG: hypothetical protein E7473_05620, partial [Ruminococcaceae bacterium]|nr:hypothetical protein [Oscillospiraceae bacterium]